jgi:hypothetical protein
LLRVAAIVRENLQIAPAPFQVVRYDVREEELRPGRLRAAAKADVSEALDAREEYLGVPLIDVAMKRSVRRAEELREAVSSPEVELEDERFYRVALFER